ncbi:MULTISPECIES: hypothetical protein [unclassified Mesorhizobium]|uniref:hypothetical protein n=1 Tax=unclassified Mesorhizobium TaxID=325217 RepID=UPI001093724F|nr:MULTISPECIES: hypothetical protein [unclassified Mesorhizobium]TGT90877.1 hypothetical protein EN804_05950 [Mesorhizobium sp. M8A.F.Ca.ET.161.01.1.1]TGV43843.1 hypothetical protein EN785_07595 [Mesorhizobium sp. M8A.F.Ca.ET.142.01.1.1]
MGPRRVYDYSYQIECVDGEGATVERIGEMNNFAVAKAAFEAALTQRTNSNVLLREGARRVESAKTGSYDLESKTVPILARSK